MHLCGRFHSLGATTLFNATHSRLLVNNNNLIRNKNTITRYSLREEP